MYIFSLHSGNCTIYALLRNVSVMDGVVYGTLVGNFSGYDENGEHVFTACEPSKYIAGGSAFTLVEYKGELK